MNIDPMSSGSDLATDAEVDAIHDAVFITGFGIPRWQTKWFVGTCLTMVKEARESGASDDVTRPVIAAFIDQVAASAVLTPGEKENWEAIKHRMLTEAYRTKGVV